MGNHATKLLVETETTPLPTTNAKCKTLLSPSESSSSLSSSSSSSESSSQDEQEAREERPPKDVLPRLDYYDNNSIREKEAEPILLVVKRKDRNDDQGDDDDDDIRTTTTCSMSSRGAACIPSVLTFRRSKEDPLIVLPSDSHDPSEKNQDRDHKKEAEKEEHDLTVSGASETTTSTPSSCSARLRRRSSWSSNDSNQKVQLISNDAPTTAYSLSASSSILSLKSFVAKTRQQLANTTITTAATKTSTTTTSNNNNLQYTEEELAMVDGDLPTPESDLNRLRDYFIVTTAALPWMTGTAVNPLLRAASLSRYQRQHFLNGTKRCTVTLVVPWLEVASDRHELYGEDWIDKTRGDQEAYIRDWLSQRANMPEEAKSPSEGGIRILFYPARYHSKLSSIFAMGDLCEFIVTHHNLTICRKDAVCILEEPEHVHFYRAQHWRDHFSFVSGVIHTNYRAYAESATLAGSFITGPLIGTISSWLVRAYCDKVIKLSPVLQSFDCPEREVISNVHGIRQEFIDEGTQRAQRAKDSNDKKNGDKIYFVGKLLWAKGLDKLLELEAFYRGMKGDFFPIDIYGSGPEQEEIEQEFLSEWPRFLGGGQSYCSSNALADLESSSAATISTATDTDSTGSITHNRIALAKKYYSTFIRPKPPVPARFMGRQDHAVLTKDYKIFVNPSITEVLCTTTAEATAMGKFVIIPDHPSNSFFHQFPNCFIYKSKAEFVEFLEYAMTHEPEPLSDNSIHLLTWEAATERFIEASVITRRDAKRRERVGTTKKDERIAKLHYELGKGAKGDVLRKVLGGGPVADQFQYDCRLLQQ